MATKRKYGYYLKGNKIAIIEEGLGSGLCSLSGYNTQSACEDAGGTWTSNGVSVDDGDYRSPIESIADGLEIQYSYSPQYKVDAASSINVNRFYINGWTVIGGYLAFLKGLTATQVDWTSSPYSAVTSGSSGGGSNDYIVVRGSDRWNGLHKIQTASADGQLITYTKVSEVVPYFEDQDIDTLSTGALLFDGGGSSNLNLHTHFSTSDYIWLSGTAVQNNGLYSISSTTASDTDTGSKLTVGTKYFTIVQTETVDKGLNLNQEGTRDGTLISTSGVSTVNIYKAYRDFCYIDTNIDVLDDETFELDLSRYQANAVVYYLKAKMAEDSLDMEAREFFLREFKRQIEKGNSALKRGPYIIQGLKEIR